MITYPSTHGVFEDGDRARSARLVHAAGGQVYMDGANLNAQAGLAKPATIGADVCHLNLHKTFCIPHGGGGPGMGPIAVAAHLAPVPARDPFDDWRSEATIGSVSAAPYGSALILPISWMYMRMMGAGGVRRRPRSRSSTPTTSPPGSRPTSRCSTPARSGRVAHECILDLRTLKPSCGVSAEDVAKRLMDYGFHAPTLSFPVADTLMVEPTESESQGRARPLLRRDDRDPRRDRARSAAATGSRPTTR